MYVTKKIDLPTFLFEGRYEEIDGFFPLEVNVHHTKIPGYTTKYEIIELKKFY